jgi:biotin carboxyl carrier protein
MSGKQYSVKLTSNTVIDILEEHGTCRIKGVATQTDVVQTGPGKFHLLLNNQSFDIELLSKDETGKQIDIAVNGKRVKTEVSTPLDNLLKSMGMDNVSKAKQNVVKAPMPGMVLRIIAKEGDAVKKGDALLILEAMKMENIIKSPMDGVVKKIVATEKTAIDKNQVLVELN